MPKTTYFNLHETWESQREHGKGPLSDKQTEPLHCSGLRHLREIFRVKVPDPFGRECQPLQADLYLRYRRGEEAFAEPSLRLAVE